MLRLAVTILFLNQYFPPDPAPTGLLLHQIGETMREAGHRVEYVSAGQSYGEKATGPSRLLRELQGLMHILRKGIASSRPDIVFSTTSPPCLLAVATLIARHHRARSVHWAMDLYPELAATLGEISPGVTRVIRLVMGPAYRAAALVAALDSDMVDRLRKYRIDCLAMRPWVLFDSFQPDVDLLQQQVRSPAPVWLYSGNLGRAHEWKTLLDAQALLEKRGSPAILAFQGSGPGWFAAAQYARQIGLKQCTWRDYAPEDCLLTSLLSASVLIATQRPETRGMLWPSKLALLGRLPRPILWVGPGDSAIAEMLRQRGGFAIFPPGSPSAIADWLEKVFSNVTSFCPVISDACDSKAGPQWWKARLEELQ